jgi:hypothetical protein
MTSVNLHIELLVLEGLPIGTHEAPLVQAAIEAELTRLITAQGVAQGRPSGSTVPLVRADAMATPASGGAALGTQIAQSIFREIGSPVAQHNVESSSTHHVVDVCQTGGN